MGRVRVHSKIDSLPPEERECVNRMLIEGCTYEQIGEYLKGKGFDISKSSVGRYGKGFLERVRQIRIVEDKANALVDQVGDDALILEEGASKMLATAIMDRLLKDDIEDLDKLVASFARLQSSSVQRVALQKKLQEKARKVAESVTKTVKKAGLSQEMAEEIQRKILGIAD